MTRAEIVSLQNIVLAHAGVNPASFHQHRHCDIANKEITLGALATYRAIFRSLSHEEREAARARLA